MKFYAHPAHGFPGTPESTPTAAAASDNAKSVRSTKASRQSGNMVAARSRREHPGAALPANLQFDP
jgi:hypothetical protein